MNTRFIEKGSNPDNKHVCADILNKISETGIPDHKIIVKIGALCILMRNLNFDEGLVKGTKFFIKSIGRFVIEGYIPENPNKTFLIPRIIFNFRAGKSGIEIMRRQFPIKLAYALTINKAQGQTLNFVGVDLRENVFAHGQLYVALSRVRSAENISILTRLSKYENNSLHTANPDFKELLPM